MTALDNSMEALDALPVPFIKKVFDLAGAIVLLLLTAPLLVLISIAIKLDLKGPILFRTVRVGRMGKPFTLYKFRSMWENAEEDLERFSSLNLGGKHRIMIPDDPRVTWVGKIIRKNGLDELPQIINVFRGEMSLIGPRPQSPAEVALYTAEQRTRLTFLPGITGLWQVSSRKEMSFEKWIQKDLEYIDHWSFQLDMKILVKTLYIMIFHQL